MTEKWRVGVCYGKYIVHYASSGNFYACRYGEPWRELAGDSLIYWLAVELMEARQKPEKIHQATGCRFVENLNPLEGVTDGDRKGNT